MTRVRHFDDFCIDHRQIRRHWNAVVEEARVLKHALIIEDVFLVKRPANALCCAALHLAFNVGRVNGFAGVLNGGIAQYVNLASFAVYAQITKVYGECCTRTLRI